jgi:type II secretory pathway pseudopilin PulG
MSPSQPPSTSAPFASDDCSEVSLSDGNPGLSEQSGRSSSGKGGADFSSSDATQRQELAARESQAVRNLRLVMLLVLLAMAVLAAALIYVFSRSSEKAGFQSEFESAGSKVLSGFQEDFLRKMQAMDSLSKSVTSFATNSNATWPFVTVPDTAELFQPYLDLTGAAALTVMPFVAPRERANWESYVEQEQGWIDRALEQRSKMDSTFDYQIGAQEALEKTVPRFIHNYVGLDTSPGPWTVWHQYAPVISNKYFVNFNRQAITDFKFELEAITRKNAVFSKASTYVPGLDFQSTLDFNFMNELLYSGGNGKYKAGEPIGYIYYPIFQDVDDETTDPVGVVMATVYWKVSHEERVDCLGL